MQADPDGNDLDARGPALIPSWLKPPQFRRAAAPPSLAKGHLFIFGAARSGTTVLQNALNHSPDVFLLGEPDLRGDIAPGFAARYNARHRGWGNQETKSTLCPAILTEDGTWRDYLQALGDRHRWVGAKLVINPVRPADDLTNLFDFHCRHFHDAYYVFAFRDPLATALSTRDLQVLSRGDSDGIRVIMRNFTDVVALYARMLRNFPNVRAVFHEDRHVQTFEGLQRWLGVPLVAGGAYYDAKRVRTYDDAQLTPEARESMDVIRQLYADLRNGAARGFATPQLEQNDGHLSSNHYTLLGSIDRRARILSEHLSK